VALLLQTEEFLRSKNKRKSERGDYDFSDRTDRERTQSLFRHLTEIRAQANTRKRQKKGPTRKIRQRSDLIFVEEGCRREN
jgi:hypothetical protein